MDRGGLWEGAKQTWAALHGAATRLSHVRVWFLCGSAVGLFSPVCGGGSAAGSRGVFYIEDLAGERQSKSARARRDKKHAKEATKCTDRRRASSESSVCFQIAKSSLVLSFFLGFPSWVLACIHSTQARNETSVGVFARSTEEEGTWSFIASAA